jgi:hypothetical protein
MARRCCSLLAIRYSLLFPSALLATVPLRWYCPDCAPTLGAPPLDEAAASSDDAAAASEDGRYSRGSFDDEPAEDMLDDAASDVPPAARSDDAMSLVGSDAAAPHDEVASTRSGGTGLVTSLGTQLLSSDDLEDLNNRLLKCKIATGKQCGDIVFIPRMTLDADANLFPFKWSRRQFPVRVAFAMTINKAQGQTLRRVGVYLPSPCFTHGQLYVATSRVGLPEHLRFAVPLDEATGLYRTQNIVFYEALSSPA